MCTLGRAVLAAIGWLMLAGGAGAAEPDANPGCPRGYAVDDSGNVYTCDRPVERHAARHTGPGSERAAPRSRADRRRRLATQSHGASCGCNGNVQETSRVARQPTRARDAHASWAFEDGP